MVMFAGSTLTVRTVKDIPAGDQVGRGCAGTIHLLTCAVLSSCSLVMWTWWTAVCAEGHC